MGRGIIFNKYSKRGIKGIREVYRRNYFKIDRVAFIVVVVGKLR